MGIRCRNVGEFERLAAVAPQWREQAKTLNQLASATEWETLPWETGLDPATNTTSPASSRPQRQAGGRPLSPITAGRVSLPAFQLPGP